MVLKAVVAFAELSIGNIVRRVLHMVREESQQARPQSVRSTLESPLAEQFLLKLCLYLL